jgi:hypothetical protein
VPNGQRAKGTRRDVEGNAKQDERTLDNYIGVADELDLLPGGWKLGVQAVLRDIRNYVHPRREIKEANRITQGEAFQSVGLLMKVLDHIQANHP